jgi:hypothetical protein
LSTQGLLLGAAAAPAVHVVYDMLPRLALLTSYIGDSTIAPADGADLTAAGPSSSSCTKAPSVTLTDVITGTSPGSGWCGGSSSNTLEAPGAYALSVLGSIKGTQFLRFECYNTSSGTAGSQVNITAGGSITIQSREAWVCAAGNQMIYQLIDQVQGLCMGFLTPLALKLPA